MNEKYVRTKIQLAKIKSQKLRGEKTDLEIQGEGPLNRDGMPQLPPDQKAVEKWPVLDLGVQPHIAVDDWSLKIQGLCEHPQTIDFKTLQSWGVVSDTSDFHCVTGWSRLGLRWRGVPLAVIMKKVGVLPQCKFVFMTASDGYSTNIPRSEAIKDDVLLVFEVEGAPLPKEHGGPVRMITPQLWAWKGAKWISGIEFLEKDRRGFWEVRGYSNSAIPWLNDRYTTDESPEETESEPQGAD